MSIECFLEDARINVQFVRELTQPDQVFNLNILCQAVPDLRLTASRFFIINHKAVIVWIVFTGFIIVTTFFLPGA